MKLKIPSKSSDTPNFNTEERWLTLNNVFAAISCISKSLNPCPSKFFSSGNTKPPAPAVSTRRKTRKKPLTISKVPTLAYIPGKAEGSYVPPRSELLRGCPRRASQGYSEHEVRENPTQALKLRFPVDDRERLVHPRGSWSKVLPYPCRIVPPRATHYQPPPQPLL